jgi:voltage-gated potassium channel
MERSVKLPVWSWVARTVTERDSPSGKAFDTITQCLIVLSIISFSIESLPNIDREAHKLLGLFETVCVVFFTVEYLIRVAASSHKLRFIFSFMGLVDLCAIVPFYLSTGVDLRSIRAIRLLRSLRLLKLARYNAAMRRYRVAFDVIKEELALFAFAAALLIYLSSVGIYYFEHTSQPEKYSSIFHSLWWSVSTLTTVAYGDVYPVTTGGKAFTFVVTIIGVGLVAVPTGLFASALSKARQICDEEENGKV